MGATKAEAPLVERLRDRARLFNDNGLRYGVADLLDEAAEKIADLEARLA